MMPCRVKKSWTICWFIDTVPELDRWMDLLKQYHALHAFYADAHRKNDWTQSHQIAISKVWTLSRWKKICLTDLDTARLIMQYSTLWLLSLHILLAAASVVLQFHDGVYLVLLMGLLEGYFVPLYHYHLTPTTNEQKVD